MIFPTANADPGRPLSHLDGRLLVAVRDLGRGALAPVQASLRTASGVVRLRVPGSQRAQLQALAGQPVRAQGVRVKGAFNAVSLEPTSPDRVDAVASPRLAATSSRMLVAVVLMHLPGSKAEPVATREAGARFFGRRRGQASVAQWFAEASGGQMSVTGTVFGYYNAPLATHDCNLSDWLRVASTAAARDGYSASRYSHLVVYTPRQRCSFAGSSYVGSSGVYLNGSLRQTVAEHELSHNLGLWNAGAYQCSPAAATCLDDTGDPIDIMGNAYANRHYSAVHKFMLGWIPSAEVRTVSSGAETIALTASERPVVTGSTQLILVPRGDGTAYAIDRRESFGHDSGASGVWVRIVARTGTDDTELPVGGALAPGESYADPAKEITIRTLSETGPTASVRVCIGPCGGAATSTTTTAPPATTPSTSPPPSGGPQPPVSDAGSAASREIIWAGCWGIVSLTDAQLDAWRARGIGGFACEIQHMAGLGGAQSFSADPNATLTGSQYDLERQIRDSKIVARAAARGIKLWIGIYLSNFYQHDTPLEPWFNDAAWSTTLLPRLGDLAGAARMLGFTGLAFDEEQYDGAGWDWQYPNNTHTEAAVRDKVRQRGAQMMQTIVNAFPGVDLLDYGTYFPEGWNDLVQQQINHASNPYARFVQINLWDGLTSVNGYGPIRFMDATFYKAVHLFQATWGSAMTYNINREMAYLSRNLSNWSYASTRVQISPFAWIDGDVANEGEWTAPRDPAYVASQLAAFRRWGMGGAFSIYSYAPLGTFDYGPYAAGMLAASAPGTVDSQPPAITITAAQPTADGIRLSGFATDDTAVSSVRWQADGASGAAPMTWSVTGGSWSTGYQWRMNWSATIPATAGQVILLTAQDSTGNTTDATVTAP